MAWYPPGDKPLSEPMMVKTSFIMSICDLIVIWVLNHCGNQGLVWYPTTCRLEMYIFLNLVRWYLSNFTVRLNLCKVVKPICTPLFKSNRIFFCNVKKWHLNSKYRFAICDLYYQVLWYKQVKFRNISFVRLVSVVVYSQQSSKNAMLNSQMSWKKCE